MSHYCWGYFHVRKGHRAKEVQGVFDRSDLLLCYGSRHDRVRSARFGASIAGGFSVIRALVLPSQVRAQNRFSDYPKDQEIRNRITRVGQHQAPRAGNHPVIHGPVCDKIRLHLQMTGTGPISLWSGLRLTKGRKFAPGRPHTHDASRIGCPVDVFWNQTDRTFHGRAKGCGERKQITTRLGPCVWRTRGGGLRTVTGCRLQRHRAVYFMLESLRACDFHTRSRIATEGDQNEAWQKAQGSQQQSLPQGRQGSSYVASSRPRHAEVSSGADASRASARHRQVCEIAGCKTSKYSGLHTRDRQQTTSVSAQVPVGQGFVRRRPRRPQSDGILGQS